MIRIRFIEVAEIELDQAIEYYNYESPGLGDAFLTEVLKGLDRIGEFPYGIIYQVRQDEILIVAIANLHRRPDYWEYRI